MPGTLFVVATPIGNLEDLSFRALRTLREVNLIAAEDTRRTAKLLAHYEIRCSMVSLREHNETRETPRLLARLAEGEDIALVSDAGTPGISDPGARLVRAAHARKLRVVPIPGPSAVAAALSASGFSADQFVFMGFPPSSGAARDRWLEELAAERRTTIFFESPHRIERTLRDARVLLGIRPMTVARELTKINEELVDSQNGPVNARGEFTVVVSELLAGVELAEDVAGGGSEANRMFAYLTETLGVSAELAWQATAVAFRTTVPRIRKAAKHARYADSARERSGLP